MALGSVVGVIPQKPLTIFPPFKWISAGRVYDAYQMPIINDGDQLTVSLASSSDSSTNSPLPEKCGVGQAKDGQLPRSN